MIRFAWRVARDRRGNAAIEFALVFPVIFVLNVAAAEALQAYQAQRAVAHIAAAMADITAQNRSVSDSDLNDIFLASVSMIQPFPDVNLQQRVSSMSASAGGTVTTDWTANKDYAEHDTPSVPGGYLAPNESAIVTDVIYDYKPAFGLFLPKTIRMVRHAYIRPRLSSKVDKVSG